MTDFTTVNTAVQKLIDADRAADAVVDAAQLKAALDADNAADAVVIKAKDDEIAALKVRIAELEAGGSIDVPTVSIGNLTAAEQSGVATFKVTLDKAYSRMVMVDFKTIDGTAKAGADYTAASGSLTFAPDQISRDIIVRITNDTVVESNESFTVQVSNVRIASPSPVVVATGTIVSDDVTPPVEPPPATGQPTAATTGAKGTLTAYTGTKTITADNVTIENKTITGSLRVTGANFVMKNCKLTYTGSWGVDAEGAANPTIQDSTIIGPGTAGAANSGFLGSGTLLRNDWSQAENGIVLQGGKSVVKGNYIHDLNSNRGSEGHYDGISAQGGQNDVLIEGNAVHARDTSDVFIKNDFGDIRNVRVNANWLLGNPGWCAYSDGRGPRGTITGVQFTNNICRIHTRGQYFSIDLNTVVKTGNVDTAGKPVS